jgi:uncharacterized protein YjlB
MDLPPDLQPLLFADDGETPNHPRFPLLIMRATAAAAQADPASWFEQRFTSNGWGATWRWKVYPYHHFHSTSHEVLGVSRGAARLMLGGEKGTECEVSTGDVIIIPAGVAHKSLSDSEDFQVVGAYPHGMKPDLIRSGSRDLEAARQRIAAVPTPDSDPVHGPEGPLLELWRK